MPPSKTLPLAPRIPPLKRAVFGPLSLAKRTMVLRVREEAVVAARDELVVYDLVAYQAPLTQVLSLPRARVERGGPAALQELLRTLADQEPSTAARRNP
ncbi:MAG: hypothetical protein NTY19_41935 [Planctomycetota bacterium]|nr:hypothetical protein [Planctomycetota bacterium]